MLNHKASGLGGALSMDAIVNAKLAAEASYQTQCGIVPKEREIPASLDALDSACNRLHMAVDELEIRLRPAVALRPESPAREALNAPRGSSIGSALESLTARVHGAASRLRELEETVQL
jgi:hypothetical protein